jgi:hypothetical protein
MNTTELHQTIREIVIAELVNMLRAYTTPSPSGLSTPSQPPRFDPEAERVAAFLRTLKPGEEHRANVLFVEFTESAWGDVGRRMTSTLFGRRAMSSGLVNRRETSKGGRVYSRKG